MKETPLPTGPPDPTALDEQGRQIKDMVARVRKIREQAAGVKDPGLREKLSGAKVELFTNVKAPVSGIFAEYIEQGLLEIVPIKLIPK